MHSNLKAGHCALCASCAFLLTLKSVIMNNHVMALSQEAKEEESFSFKILLEFYLNLSCERILQHSGCIKEGPIRMLEFASSENLGIAVFFLFYLRIQD